MSSVPDTGRALRQGTSGPVSLYVHVPFCVLKCAYCDFHSAALSASEPDLPSHFAWAVREAVAHWAARGILDDVVSVYIGGGTPTALGDGLADLVSGVLDACSVRRGAEVTVETNPDTTDEAGAERLVEAGVTRFSLGVQSLDDAVLATLGRCHDAAAAQRALRTLMGTGARVSVDLMCGVPGQSLASWRTTVERVAESGAGHVSIYPLALEDGTALARRVRAGRAPAPDADEAAEMMELADGLLGSAGLHRYEIASYARPAERCVHNTGYWTGRPYIGIGPSAASMLPAETFAGAAACASWADPLVAGVGRVVGPVPEDAARVRFTRAADTVVFVRGAAGAPEEIEYLTAEEALREDAMLGLRLSEGISSELAEAAGAAAALTRMIQAGLVETAEGGRRLRLTRAGWLLGNEVFEQVWSAGT